MAAAPAAARPEAVAAAQRGERRRLLVVDDNLDAAESLALLLTKAQGYDVRRAHSGPEALEVAHDFVPEVILLDIGLPGMDGYEVARAVRADRLLARCHVIAVTGYGRDEDRRRSSEAGFDHHLVKPVTLAALQAVLALSPRAADGPPAADAEPMSRADPLAGARVAGEAGLSARASCHGPPAGGRVRSRRRDQVRQVQIHCMTSAGNVRVELVQSHVVNSRHLAMIRTTSRLLN